MATSCSFVVFLFVVAVPGQAAKTLTAKKVIEWGWDEPNTRFIRENIERMEKHPFDGPVVLRVDGAERTLGSTVAHQVFVRKEEPDAEDRLVPSDDPA